MFTSDDINVLLGTLPRLDIESDQAAFLRQEILLHTGHRHLETANEKPEYKHQSQ